MTPAPPLPEHPGLDSYCELADSLSFLGCDHIVSFLLAGQDLPFMVLDGVWIRAEGFSWQPVSRSYLEKVGRSWERDSDPLRRARAEHVIGLLRQMLAGNNAALRQLALFQVRKLLQARGTGYPRPEQVRADARALSIVEEEVDLLVAAVLAAQEGPGPEMVEAAIRARWSKQLRSAARLADLLDPVATDETLRAFLRAVRVDNRRLDAALAEAAALERGGQREEAAACYLAAAALARDEPEAEAGLGRCPPPAPQKLKVDVRGERVDLRWAPSGASAGVLAYRVMRVSAAGHVLVGEVAHGPCPQATDTSPPLGREISYEVRTVRGGRVESAPAASAVLRVVPDAEGLRVYADRHGVAGSWRVPKGAAAVRVTRRETAPGHNPGEEVAVGSGLTQFRDADVLAGRRYLYEVACGYREAGGELIWSAGRVMGVPVAQWPQPVTEVHAAATADGGGVILRWASPGAGSVAVLEVASAAATAPEIDLPVADLGPLGRVCWHGQAKVSGTDMRCEVLLPGMGEHHLAMVTVLGERAVTGAVRTAEVLGGVRCPTAERSGNTIAVSWEWPPDLGLTQVLVRWAYPGEPPGQPLRITRDRYRRRRVEIPARDSGCTITITPLSTIPGCVSVGPPAVASVAPQYEVSYQVRRGRSSGLIRSVSLQASGTTAGGPVFTLISRPGQTRPTRLSQGEKVLEVDMAHIAAAQQMEYPVGRQVQRPCYLLGFVTGPGSEHFRLAHPDRSQLVVER